ncbi:DUF6809 family protein [Lacrimispora sp. 210928-DFI.3.58]|uniref:DUF6809 family protein n=1 Tax=Lacrimispora sp. 210928-DFI.3.58 TaxID=2883214 RepID=UPI001D072697|nr:DUF6809 family protein [Lacrimispora sp. 210928-DFI.3.58]MCB7317157.1 hypothetical protein [Lacrimispora sp. 210928-DFI.3.58]
MIHLLKEIYGLIYGELTQTAEMQWPLHREIEKIKAPLRGREDFEEVEEICLEISCCSQEYGFISGFKYGVAFMMECLERLGAD